MILNIFMFLILFWLCAVVLKFAIDTHKSITRHE